MKLPLVHPVWYKAKDYGRGRYPVTWQAWFLLFLCVVIIIGITVVVAVDPLQWQRALPRFLVMIGLQIALCYLTGEKPRWRCGKKK